MKEKIKKMITVEDLQTKKFSFPDSLPDICLSREPSIIDTNLQTREWRVGTVYVVEDIDNAKGEAVNWCKFCERYVVNKCVWQSQKKYCKQ
jgi:hypothetical protein